MRAKLYGPWRNYISSKNFCRRLLFNNNREGEKLDGYNHRTMVNKYDESTTVEYPGYRFSRKLHANLVSHLKRNELKPE